MLTLFKKILSLSLLTISLNAEITLKEIDSKPASRAKNFLIWQYLKQDITQYQADKAYEQILGNHSKLNRVYLKKSDNKELKYKISCKKKQNLLAIKDDKCFELAITPYKTVNMTDEERLHVVKRVTSPSQIALLNIQSEPNTQEAYQKYDSATVLKVFTSSGYRYRRNNLNINLSSKFINRLSTSPKMSSFISTVVRDDKLDKLQKSLLHVKGENVDAPSNFLLALHSLKYSKKKQAVQYLQISHDKTKKRFDRDKAMFWLYLITKNRDYLQKLLLSMDINIYSLYAHDLLGVEVVNFFTKTSVDNKLSDINLQNPFEWSDLLSQIKETPKENLFELSNTFEQKNMIPVNAFVLEKAYNFNMHGFIMPYDKHLSTLSTDEKAFVYSIMRQESNYIPAALSRSFALGLMQLMPFLVDAIAKESKEKVAYKDMFRPEKNIEYSLKHLKWMRKSLTHPLFMAYAYNGGLGFLRKHLKTGAFIEAKYEPYLSMEMMGNSQSREYGKRVIANYIMYKQILGEKISIVNLLENVIQKKKIYHSRG